MATVKIQKIPHKKEEPEDVLALFCFYFQQYTFSQARKMPYKRIRQMLSVVRREEARKNIELLQIVSAPHGKKGSAKSLLERYNAIINE